MAMLLSSFLGWGCGSSGLTESPFLRGEQPCSRPQRLSTCAPSRVLTLEVSAKERRGTGSQKIGPGKKWEHYKLTANGKPVRIPMHVVRGDMVVVIAGSDRGKVGKVTTTLYKTGQVVVEGVNEKYRTQQAKSAKEKGTILLKPSPIHHSNVMHWSEKEKVRSRMVRRKGPDGKRHRFLVKTGEQLPDSQPAQAQA